MKVSAATLLPLLSKLGGYFKLGVDHYADLRASGFEASPEVVAMFIQLKMTGWEPEVAGKRLLDPETKTAAARMLAGLIINLSTDKTP